jgi:hypothetical protein
MIGETSASSFRWEEVSASLLAESCVVIGGGHVVKASVEVLRGLIDRDSQLNEEY